MKYLYLFFLFYFYYINCQSEFLEYYINYTLISPVGVEKNIYYFFPHYEVGTVNFIIYFSQSILSCHFTVYDGEKEIDYFSDFYQDNINHVLKIPESNPKPNILKLQVENYRYNLPYYLYIYNDNYTIPLNISNYNFYHLSLKNLEINYEIKLLEEDIYLKFQSLVEFPEYTDNIQIKLNDGEIEHSFNETASFFDIKLKKGNEYKLNLKCNLFSQFTSKNVILIYFEKEEKPYNNLRYNNDTNTHKSILPIDKIYFIDTINLIDEYNSYSFILEEMSLITRLQDIKIKVYIKKYSTYDLNYIKNNTPSYYDESVFCEKKNFIFKTDDDLSKKVKTILIYFEINYSYIINPLYQYSIQKITSKKNLEFKSYFVNWYTKYDFEPLLVDYKDIIFITTNHSNTIFPIVSSYTRTFTSFFKGYLFVSFPEKDIGLNKVLINYDDEKSELKDEDDMGYFEVYKLENKDNNTFEVININNDLENKIYNFELKNDTDKYYYIIINQNDNNQYYLYHENIDNYSYLIIEQMPINIISFSQNKTNKGIQLLNNKNEFIFKIGYLKPVFNLFKLYLIKNENNNLLYLSEGQIKIYTFPKNNNRINLDINLISKNLTKKNYINIKIPSDKIEGNLYIKYNNEKSGQKYLLNNSGINLFYIDNYSFNIDIINNDNINEDIPILIKFPINKDNIKVIDGNKKYDFISGQIGLYKFDGDKKIKMKLKSEKKNFNIYYYVENLSEDFFNNTKDFILSPELFNTKEFNTSKTDFEVSTELDIEKTKLKKFNNINSYEVTNSYNLFLIFSFNEKVVVNYEKETIDDEKNLVIWIVVLSVLIPIIISIPIIYCFVVYKKKKKMNLILEAIETPFKIEEAEEEIINKDLNYNKPIENDYPDYNELKTDDGNKGNANPINNIGNISIENIEDNEDLPAPSPKYL